MTSDNECSFYLCWFRWCFNILQLFLNHSIDCLWFVFRLFISILMAFWRHFYIILKVSISSYFFTFTAANSKIMNKFKWMKYWKKIHTERKRSDFQHIVCDNSQFKQFNHEVWSFIKWPISQNDCFNEYIFSQIDMFTI